MSRPALFVIACSVVFAAEFPEAAITNGLITAKLYLPDPQRGYYRGTRFDWSGNTYSLKTAKHEYFGQWFPTYDPKLHDAIMGPVEEFRTEDGGPGYAEAAAGETFVRIGVGVVRKPTNSPYEGFKTYDIVDHGRWKVKKAKDQIQFTHILKAANGYAYRYTKTMRLLKDKPTLVIEHTLENTGKKAITASQYNHNFFVIDGQPSGPATYVKFPFDLKPVRAFDASLAEVRGGEVKYLKELAPKQSVFGEFQGFGATASDYDIRVENRNAKAGVHIRGDKPLSKVVFWSIRTVFSPEPYIDINAAPGGKMSWTYTYDFYDLP
ncbi:MAG: hypothetical protein IT168_00875 [Bryobacterales bacterium]|nr:hypothetical protein [Bryobacterales bacterium]